MNITEEELDKSINFFKQNNISILENQARKINKKQPNFTAMIYAMEMHGFSRVIVEDILETIFVVYYIQTELRNIEINTISIGQIAKNQQSFSEFISYFNTEKKYGEKIDLSKVTFLKDQIVLNYAVKTLQRLFNKVEKFPNEILIPYFAILKAIELGAEKRKK